MNTSKVKIDWKSVNKDDTEKLRALKGLIKDWETQLPATFYRVAMDIINNVTFYNNERKSDL